MRSRLSILAVVALATTLVACPDEGSSGSNADATADATGDTGGADGGADTGTTDTGTTDTGTTDTGGTDTGGTDTGGTDTGGTDTGGTDTGGTDTGPVTPTCADYCSAVQAACGDTGPTSQYTSVEDCLAYCGAAELPIGTSDDTSGNTLGCRTYHATVAGGDGMAELHCPHAGPTGGDVCGTWCDNYCHLAETACDGTLALYASAAECATACGDIATDGTVGAVDGDSIQCRLYHLGIASSSEEAAATHCPHGGTDGGGVCVAPGPTEPTCEAYCDAIQSACGDAGANSQYPSKEACLAYCADNAELPIGTIEDTSGNTVGCRLYHATVAGGEGAAALHCPHAGPTGGDTCGTWCDNYCHLEMTACTGNLSNYASLAECTTACAGIPTDAAIGAVDGDSIQCRLYHLGVASTSDTAAATHCPHGGADGAGVCVAPGPTEPTCEAYCDAVQAACGDSGETSQYPSTAACLTYCTEQGKLPTGTLEDAAGNTIGCRLYHATVAAGDGMAALHCPHAGPSGGDVCGTWCTNYCHLALSNCAGGNALYANDDECLTACSSISKDGAANDSAGDSVQCRIYHLGVAGSNEAAAVTHCPHGTTDGGGVCVDAPELPSCEDYCATVQEACGDTGANAQYGSEVECITYCEQWGQIPEGTLADTGGNTIGCRLYHASVALTDPGAHCAHAGPSGGDVCGSWCDNYCHLELTNCTGDNAVYADLAECSTACEALSTDGEANATGGDSVQCRIYHLGVAGSNPPGSAATHCPHTAPDGGGVCVAPPPTCAEYCDAVTASCSGGNAQYASVEACLSYCTTAGALPAGTVDDTSGNTIGCRLYHATVAGQPGNEATHCPHAGPTGDGVCGSWCDNYCHLALTNCTGANALYADMGECAMACAAFDASAEPGADAGDSVQCRVYHLGVAGASAASADMHCAHGGADGGGVCVDPDPTCADYCTAVMSSCGGENAQYASEAACLDYCGTWAMLPAGSFGDTGGNTLGCRIYHAGVAGQPDNAATHCPHTGPDGGGVCGSWCDNYCHLAASNCTGGNALYASDAECQTACAALSADGSAGDDAGDSVQCRIYHLGVAGSNLPDSAAAHCPHGAPDGGGICVDEVAPAATCADYCAAVTASCTGDDAQYGSEAACLDYCTTWAALPAGTTADTSGNTVGCRLYHATVASLPGNAATHCPHAGPSGDGVCGSWCDNYCHLASANCTGANEIYASDSECMTACAALSTGGGAGDADGDTVQCRVYHLGVAGSNMPDSANTHCPHAGPDGGGVCVDPEPPAATCAEYCTEVMASCTGDDAQYGSEAACLDYCTTWAMLEPGFVGQTSGNTVGCRLYHATVAGEPNNAATHCPHAGPSGGDVCGSWCDNYCHLAMTNCTGANELYASDGACETACATLSEGGLSGDADGDTVQCRIYHLGVAGSNVPDSANTHCSHGGLDGDGVCVDLTPLEGKLVINEVDYDQPGTDAGEFVEILNVGPGPVSLADYSLEMVNGSNSTVYGTYALSTAGASLPANGILVVANQAVYDTLAADQLKILLPANGLQNGAPDGVRIVRTDATVIDGLAYEGELAGTGEGTSPADTDTGDGSLARCPNGSDSGDNSADFILDTQPSPGIANACVPVPPVTYADVQPIYQTYCGGCHTGGGSGGHNIGTSYADSQKASYLCAGKTKGECTLVQIQSGYMPLGGGCSGDPATDAGKANCLTFADQSLIQDWIDDGQLPAPAP